MGAGGIRCQEYVLNMQHLLFVKHAATYSALKQKIQISNSRGVPVRNDCDYGRMTGIPQIPF